MHVKSILLPFPTKIKGYLQKSGLQSKCLQLLKKYFKSILKNIFLFLVLTFSCLRIGITLFLSLFSLSEQNLASSSPPFNCLSIFLGFLGRCLKSWSIDFKSENDSIVMVNEKGLVSIMGAGETTIKNSVIDNVQYTASSSYMNGVIYVYDSNAIVNIENTIK